MHCSWPLQNLFPVEILTRTLKRCTSRFVLQTMYSYFSIVLLSSLSNVRNINRDYFMGRPVVSVDTHNRAIMFNTDMIQAQQQQQQQQPQQPLMMVPQSMHQAKLAEAEYAPQPVYAAQPVDSAPTMATVVSTPQQPRSMQIRIPEGAAAGSVLTVMSPEGTQVQVSVPPNATPGSEITIQY